jgi:hypothetical protein
MNAVDLGTSSEMRMVVNGTEQKTASKRNRNDPDGTYAFTYVGVHRLSAGANTLAIQHKGTGAGTKRYRRSRIIIFRCNAFNMIVNQRDETNTVPGTSMSSLTTPVFRNYIPEGTEHVIVIANALTDCSSDGASAGLGMYDYTNAEEYGNIISAERLASGDLAAMTVFSCNEISAETLYELRGRKWTGVSNVKNIDLIAWGMTLAVDLQTADDTVDLVPSADVTAEWPLGTGSPHHEQVDDSISDEVAAMTDYIGVGAASKTDEFTMSGVPTGLRFTQKIAIAFVNSGNNIVVDPGTTFTLTGDSTGLGDMVYIDETYNMLAAPRDTGFVDVGDIAIPRAELVALVHKLKSIDGSGQDLPGRDQP